MNWPEDDEHCFREEDPLRRIDVNLCPCPEGPEASPTPPTGGQHSREAFDGTDDPGNAVLVANLGPNNPELLQPLFNRYERMLRSTRGSTDTDGMELAITHTAPSPAGGQQDATLGAAREVPSVVRHDSANSAEVVSPTLAAKALAVSARAVMDSREADGDMYADSQALESRTSAKPAGLLPATPEQRPLRTSSRSPLKLRTASPKGTMQAPPPPNITASPILQKHVVPRGPGVTNKLPAVQSMSPIQDGEERPALPSFRTLNVQLDQLAEAAEAAAIQAPRRSFSHGHSLSLGSNSSQSPRIQYHPAVFPINTQASPVGPYAPYSAQSPTGTIGETQYATYGSPTQRGPPAAYFLDRRRSSVVAESAAHFPPSLPSASTASSVESHGFPGTSADGYSTTHTTPADQPPIADGTPRPMQPPPLDMGGFKCEYLGCTASPFQTQYLLSSHRNVHSSSRPHYCPVEGCARSEGRKGFKRKNEMVRHGLVHSSPGYICPYCPDREHRYPRPDNLQRHVRVHHMEKDRDDPALRDVLAQRGEGAGKQRRRRTNTNGTAA